MKDYSDYAGPCETCGADLSGNPEAELAALRAELAEVLSAAAALRVAGEAAREALGAELAALRAQLAEAKAKIARLRAALEHYVDAETVVSWGYQETADDGVVAREALAASLLENAPPAPVTPVCRHDPRTSDQTGMYHCPDCGEMVLAGMKHLDWSILFDEPPAPAVAGTVKSSQTGEAAHGE